MTSKSKILFGSIVLVVIGGGYAYFTRSGTEEVVQTETVRRGDIAETVSVTGELVPEEYADLAFVSVGTIDAVFAKVGEVVEVGDKIASLDRQVLFSQLKDARITARIAEQNEQLILRFHRCIIVCICIFRQTN